MIRYILAVVCTVAALVSAIYYHVAKDRDMRLESLVWLAVFVTLATRLV